MLENKIEELTRAVERLSEILLGMPNPNLESDEVKIEKDSADQQKQKAVEPATAQEQPVSHDDNAESASRQDLQDYVLKHVRKNPKLKSQIKAILEKHGAASITTLADEHINAVFDEVKAL